MVIHRELAEIREKLPNAVATIGNFDGVHLGHREIFRRVKKAAADRSGVSVVITFIPHPLKVLPSGRDLLLINTYPEKETLIAASGVDHLIVIPFDQAFSEKSAEAFVRDVLVERIGIKSLIIGHDYAFGRQREGNILLLTRLGRLYGFSVEILDPIGNGEVIYSSSEIRRMVASGDVKGVVPILGRHFSLSGTVVHGQNRGAGLGFPTANIETEKELIPCSGVYAVKVKLDNVMYDGACNIGTNPTFGNERTSIEVFLLDFSGDLYDKEVRLYFVERIRDERKFPDLEELKRAIAADVSRCIEVLRGVDVIRYEEYLRGE